jgi:hypothetical protein
MTLRESMAGVIADILTTTEREDLYPLLTEACTRVAETYKEQERERCAVVAHDVLMFNSNSPHWPDLVAKRIRETS